MRYPKMNNWFAFRKTNEFECEVTNKLSNDTFLLPLSLVRFLKKLDGKTNPYTITRRFSRAEVKEYLEFFDDCGLIRTKTIMHEGLGTFLLPLYTPKKVTGKIRLIAWIWNTFLKYSFLPIFIFSVCYYIQNFSIDGGGLWLGSIAGTIVGILLHEFSHACATLSCKKGEFYQFGIGTQFLMPLAYVIVNERQIEKRMDRIQMYIAGCEANILVAAISLILAGLFNECGIFFFASALQNVFLAIFNLTFENGLDGMSALSELLGCKKEILSNAYEKVILSKIVRKRIFERSVTGKVFVINCCVMFVLKLALPVFYISSFVEMLVL